MATKTNKRVLMTMALALFTLSAFAQQGNYKVLYCNSDAIKIGNSIAKKNLLFDDESKIVMPKEECTIEYQNLKNGKVKQIVGKEAKRREGSLILTIKEYIRKEKTLATKGACDQDNIEFDTVFYMLDTLRIPVPWHPSSTTKAKAVAQIGNRQIEAEATISENQGEMECHVTRKALGIHDNNPFYIDIIETDTEKNWEYAVWRKLYIIPLPLKIE